MTRGARTRGIKPCLLYLFVEFVRPVGWQPALAALRPGVLAGVWGLGAVLLGPRQPVPRPVKYMFGLLLLMAWHIPWAVNNRWALWGLQDFAILILGGVLPLAVLPADLRAVRYLFSAYVFFHVPTAIHSLRHSGRGVDGWIADENDLALALNVALGIGIYLMIETRSRLKRALLALTLVLLVAGVAASLSRGGFVGLAVLGLYLLVFGPYRKTVLVLALAAVLVLAFSAPPEFWEEVGSIRDAAQPGDTGETRLYFWGIAWEMFLDHPITGVGTRNYGIRAPEYQDPNRTGWRTDTWGRVAHSLYFTLIAEQGITGTLLFFGILGWCFRLRREAGRRFAERPEDESARTVGLLASGATAGLAAVLATGAFLSVLYYPPLWVVVGLMGALGNTMKEKPAVANDPADHPRSAGELR